MKRIVPPFSVKYFIYLTLFSPGNFPHFFGIVFPAGKLIEIFKARPGIIFVVDVLQLHFSFQFAVGIAAAG